MNYSEEKVREILGQESMTWLTLKHAKAKAYIAELARDPKIGHFKALALIQQSVEDLEVRYEMARIDMRVMQYALNMRLESAPDDDW